MSSRLSESSLLDLMAKSTSSNDGVRPRHFSRTFHFLSTLYLNKSTKGININHPEFHHGMSPTTSGRQALSPQPRIGSSFERVALFRQASGLGERSKRRKEKSKKEKAPGGMPTNPYTTTISPPQSDLNPGVRPKATTPSRNQSSTWL